MGAEKRQHERRSAPGVGLVNVYAVEDGKRRFLCSSLLQDISDGGISIRTDVEVPMGAALRLKNRAIDYDVRVTRCSPMSGGYFIGLAFAKEPL